MSDLPYTDDDLRAEAARQHATLTEDPDFVGVGEQMQDTEIPSLLPPAEADGAEGPHWDELLDEDQFDEAQRKIHDLINGAADVSAWAVDIGADGLAPLDSVLSMQTKTGPLARIYFAVRPDMPGEVRTALVEGVGEEIAKYLPGAEGTAVTIPMETAAHVLWQDRLGGWPPSTFAAKLLSLWTSADTDNADRLAVAFPDYAAALDLLRSGQQGIEQLRAIAGDS
ncbi:hypothetical protein [Streptomyces purpurascens]|uniref:hypothetical protein n=1 Tax=Streptomyces purpurascens TaxID=1924 RepID=UPI001673120C|nr:hypothetical protein [Streptomyces purpurascens]MCE7049518.1 hypothetical protein [Streptomyces purpurascens]GHA22267.1 hypothetical protein GCM10010303_35970 [Streptomyces purpurascens]